VRLGVEDAVLLALGNNRAFGIERLGPAIASAAVEAARAAFDAGLDADASLSKARSTETGDVTADVLTGSVGVSRRLPTGTVFGVGLSGDDADGNVTGDSGSARLGLTVTQPLLRGAGRKANLAVLRQAELDVRASEHELRGFAEAMVADVESTYWDLALAKAQIAIYEESVSLAERQQSETEERIRFGRLAETELAAARAEVALRREALINARSSLAATRLRFIRLLNPGPDPWRIDVTLLDEPAAPAVEIGDVEEHVRAALASRPDLAQARLGIQRGDLELARTRNGLLPRMDVFISLGKSGYARSFADAFGDLDGKSYDAAVGLTFEHVFGRRSARAGHLRAELTRRRADLALENIEQLAQVDVRSAFIEVERTRAQVSATAATRAFREESLRAETEKFRVGRSTTLLVAQAQRDLVASRISEVQAVVNCLKALVELHRADGSLLDRRGIIAPGRSPEGGAGEAS